MSARPAFEGERAGEPRADGSVHVVLGWLAIVSLAAVVVAWPMTAAADTDATGPVCRAYFELVEGSCAQPANDDVAELCEAMRLGLESLREIAATDPETATALEAGCGTAEAAFAAAIIELGAVSPSTSGTP